MKCGRKSGVVAHEGGRKRGVLLYSNSYALLQLERFKIICSMCHLGGMAV